MLLVGLAVSGKNVASPKFIFIHTALTLLVSIPLLFP
jgi:hypothetical protein